MSFPADLLELAESLNTHLPLGRGDERIERPGWVAWIGAGSTHPALTVVQRFRLQPGEVEAAVSEIRALLATRGRPRSTWEIGPSATPHDLYERFIALGLVPFEEPLATGMILRRPLPETRSDVVARRAETVDDYVAALEILNAVFRERTESEAERRARAEQRLTQHRSGGGALFLGSQGGRPIAAASVLYVPGASVLSGGATLSEARGRGAYRALVAARYDDAVKRGAPTLVIQAGSMSRPILARLGFEAVAEVRILLDER